MDFTAQVRRRSARHGCRSGVPPSRGGYILAVTGVLAVVTFALVYLAAYSYTLAF